MAEYMTQGGAKHGTEAALTYYTEHGTPWYALYAGKPTARHGNVMMHNWRGRMEDVEECAQHIRDRFSDCGIDGKTRYTLAWWDEKPKMSKGTPDGPPGGSVVFVCATYDQIEERINGAMQYRERVGYANNELVSRLAAIEAKLNEPEADEDDQPEASASQAAIMGALQNPAIMQALQIMMLRLVDRVLPSAQPSPVKLAGAPPEDAPSFDVEKLNAALNILKVADPELEDDLLRLANIAQTDPGQFSFLLKMLRK